MRLTLAAAALAVAATTAPVAAQQIFTNNPAAIAAAMQGMGYRAEVATTNSGLPVLRSAAEGVNFSVYFYGCDDAGFNCRHLQLHAGFNTIDPRSMALMNQWNDENIIGQAEVNDEGDPSVSHLIVTDGTIDTEDLRANLRMWSLVLSAFTDHIDW